MPRAKDAPIRVGGQIDPYVQRSMQQSKQQAESRLLTAMQERGAGERTAMQETGATQRTTIQAGTQRSIEASRAASADRRAAEDEVARREDKKFAEMMAQSDQQFRAKQAELVREQQNIIIAGDKKEKARLERKRDAYRQFNIMKNREDKNNHTNVMLSMIKGGLKKEVLEEKTNSILDTEGKKWREDKDIYTKTVEKASEAIFLDKRMDYPTKVGKQIPTGKMITPMYGLAGVRFPEMKPEPTANPMGVIQDQINQFGGNISLENMTPGTIHNVEKQIINEEVQTEDVNKTLGVLEGSIKAVDKKRKGVDKDSEEFDFWQDNYLELTQARDTLEGLVTSKELIKGSDTETVGSRVQYSLGTVYDNTIGSQVERVRELRGDNLQAISDDLSKAVEGVRLLESSPEMPKELLDLINDENNFRKSIYPQLGDIIPKGTEYLEGVE